MAPRLPADIVEKLDMWGRFRFDPHGADIDVSEIGTLEHDMWELAQADSDAFVCRVSRRRCYRVGDGPSTAEPTW